MTSGKVEDGVCEKHVFDQVFRLHAKDLHNYLYYKYGADNHPGDLVQEAFLKLWQHCKKVPESKARAFLFTVASNQVLNDISRKKTALAYRKTEGFKNITQESPEFVLEENEYMERLKSALEKLPDSQRETFLLNRIEGMKHKEIAQLLNISQKAVEKRIYTALAALKKELKELK